MSQMRAGAILSYLSLIVSILIALLYTPVMIRLLGQSEYGLYALIGSIAAYFNIMDMGLNNAIVRFTARNRAIGNEEEESKLNGLFLILFSILGLLAVIIGLLFITKIDNIFGSSLNDSELEKAKIMVIILMINFALSFPLTVFGSIMQAYEKFVVIKLVSITRSLLIPVITLPILFIGYGSIAMVVITTVVNILCLLFNALYSIKKLKVNFCFEKIDYKLLKEIIGYSFFVFLGVIVDQIYWNTDQFILGVVAGTVPVAVYAIAMLFIKLYIQFSTSLSGLFLPKVSMMVANKATAKELTNIMIKYGRIQFVIMAFILSGFVLFGEPFINLWAGTHYNKAYYIVMIVMVPLSIPLIQNIGISILYAKNLQGFRSVVLILIAFFNVIITIPLAKYYGGIGAAIATAVSLVVGNIIVMNIYYNRKIGINIPLFWKNILLVSVPVIIVLFIGGSINYFITENSILFLSFKILIFSVIYFVIMWYFALNDYEKSLLVSIIKSFKSKIALLMNKNKEEKL
ncbi:oligosaccharide flippase family protein [Halalkalibacterium halodurans]|uniref:Teichoic acid transporter n=1 Tax=Halalkalibacterium halodurans TaxID=86665 RepID=A0A0M0KFR6_ALKHA|nr:oligosaccharide flippase family protein [Halalkalibacterium halodurans]TPE68974.1 flippase [Halalkalibacterium halodurans]